MKGYVSPIKHLYDRIIDSFYSNNTVSEARLKELAEQNLVSRSIFFNPSGGFIRTPIVHLETGEVEIQESYMAFLWCTIYNFVKMNDSARQLCLSSEDIVQFNSTSVEDLDQMNYLFDWSLSLQTKYSEWPKDFPSPVDGSEFSNTINVIFLHALSYLLYHEVAHLANNHKAYLELINSKPEELTEKECYQLKSLEVEADNYAIELLLGVNLSEDQTYIRVIGAIMAHLSNLLLIQNINGLMQLKHPDVDQRLFNLSTWFKFDNPIYQLNIEQTLNIGLSLFLHIHKIEYLKGIPDQSAWYDNFDGILEHLYQKVDSEKEKAKGSFFSSKEVKGLT
jgi:hypothetical protein